MRSTLWLALGLALAAAGCGDFGPLFGADGALDDRDGDGILNQADCAPDDPANWRLVSVYVDGDLDGRGAGAPISLCVGVSVFGGYSEDGTDCDDTRSDAWLVVARYVDADHDGVGTGELIPVCGGFGSPSGYAEATGDCAPDDGARWQELGYLHVDADGDGYTVPDAGVVCAGALLPRGYSMTERGPDCDDTNPSTWAPLDGYPDDDLDRVGSGAAATLCTAGWLPSGWAATAGDCAPDDGARWQELPYSFVDLDGDRYSVAAFGMICSGYGLPAGHSTVPSALGTDCDDGDRTIFSTLYGYADDDADGHGDGAAQPLCTSGTRPSGWVADATDCAPADPQRWQDYAYTQRDADGDAYTVAENGSICIGATVPAGYGTVASYYLDCDDTDPALFRTLGGYADADLDGFGAPPAVSVCTDGTLPSGYSSNSADCAADDPTRWRTFAFSNVDRDGDGYTVRETGPFCFGATLPDPYRELPSGNDCDDADPALYRWVVLYEDKDGDGVGTPPRWVPCLGATLPADWSIYGWDANDSNPAVISDESPDSLLTVVE